MNVDLDALSGRVLVAVSGGPDSLALLHLLAHAGPARPMVLGCLHVNHGQRAEADGDADFVAGRCAEWGVPFHLARCDVPRLARERRISLEMAGREARYQAFSACAKAEGYDCVATAHTADDQVETLLIRLLRGCSPDGLAGIPARRPLGGSRAMVVRSLLGVTRHEVEAYCRQHRLEPRHDSANDDETVLRNRVRRELLPLMAALSAGVRGNLLRVAELAARDATHLRREAALALAAACGGPRLAGLPWLPRGCRVLDIARLDHAPALLERSLAIHLEAGPARKSAQPDHRMLRNAADAVRRGAGAVEIPGAPYRWRVSQGWLMLEPTTPSPPPLPLAVQLPGRTRAEHWDLTLETERVEAPPGLRRPPDDVLLAAGSIQGRLTLRSPLKGERLRPLGAPGSRLLSDLFSSHRVPAVARAGWPILADAAGPLWVIGLATAERARGTPGAPVWRVSIRGIAGEPAA